jgi:ribose transport system permease protein
MSSTKFNQELISKTEKTFLQKLVSEQSFWVSIALLGICFVMFFVEDAFSSKDNLFNITRNFSFIGIMAIGMTFVIITAGIDLSVGSIMGVTGVICGLFLDAQYLPEWYSKASYFEGVYVWISIFLALLAGALIGAVNGYLIAYLKLSPFVVTLGMMAIARSLALVVSNNKMFYEFGPKDEMFYEIGGGSIFGVANATWLLIVLTILMGLVLKYTSYGKHVYAVGSNKKAAELSGINTRWIEMSVYIISGLFAAISAVMIVGWMGSVTNALGYTYELRVIAATVIGGANLMGGVGGTFGAFIGAALMETIRNSLLMAGIDPYWQGTFLGLFIVGAVWLEKVKNKKN